jgi:hypothetical protein
MRSLRFLLFGISFVFPLYWTSQFALYVLPELLRAVVLRQHLSGLEVSFLRATATVSNISPSLARAELLLAAVLVALLLHFFGGHHFLAGSMGMALVGQAALLPHTSVFLSGERVSIWVVLGALLAFVILCLGVEATLANMAPVGFAGRVAGVSIVLILPEAILWLVFLCAYPYFGWDFLGLLLAPLVGAALLVCAVMRREIRHTAVPPPAVEILVGFTLTGLFVLGVGLSSHRLKQQRLSEPQATHSARPLAPCEKPPGMLLLSFPEQAVAANGEPHGRVAANAGWENVLA